MKAFVDLPVWELLNDPFYSGKKFFIPSYQRGYRWESEQVKDLLQDLEEFVSSDENNYYLQPLVVRPTEWFNTDEKKEEVWEVLDGQQRLTTLLLLLICLNEKNPQPVSLYDIIYDRENGNLDFSRISYDKDNSCYNYPDKTLNPDNYYVSNAKHVIQEWYDAKMKDTSDSVLENIRACLTKRVTKKKVRFIWYDASSEDDFKTMQSIALFNRLNGGKISLTGSELVKALFYLGIEHCSYDTEMQKARFSMEWDNMERKLQDEEFWNFICPKGCYLQTRMDLLLDFTRGNMTDKKEVSYRWYQDVFNTAIFVNQNINEAWNKWKKLWMEIKDKFDILIRWFENPLLYNHIGYMVENGVLIQDFRHLGNTYAMIKQKVFKKEIEKGFTLESIDNLHYKENYTLLKKLLLLFNIETYCRHNIRFPFHLYRLGHWDIEHVNSQTENTIQNPQERIDWIKYQALECLAKDKETDSKAMALYMEGETLWENKAPAKEFADYRTEVGNYYLDNNKMDKDSIGNLTLLNSSINRSYGNALFPSKKLTVATCDQMGEFIPLCTRYLFLKYYSNGINATRMNVMRWSEQDHMDYQNTVIDYLTPYFS